MMIAAAAAAGNSDSYVGVINNLRDEKLKIETSAKEAIEKIIVEKNALSQQVDDLRVLYSHLTEEHSQVCRINEENRARILGLVDQNQELCTKLEASDAQVVELKKKQADSQAEIEADKAVTEKLVQELNDKTNSLNAQVSCQERKRTKMIFNLKYFCFHVFVF